MYMYVNLAAEFCLNPSNLALQSITSWLENKGRQVLDHRHFKNLSRPTTGKQYLVGKNTYEKNKVQISVPRCAWLEHFPERIFAQLLLDMKKFTLNTNDVLFSVEANQ